MTGPRGLFKRTSKLELRVDTVLMGSAEIARAVSATALVRSPERVARGEAESTDVVTSATGAGEPGAVR